MNSIKIYQGWSFGAENIPSLALKLYSFLPFFEATEFASNQSTLSCFTNGINKYKAFTRNHIAYTAHKKLK